MKTENVCFIINSPFSFPYLIIGVISVPLKWDELNN